MLNPFTIAGSVWSPVALPAGNSVQSSPAGMLDGGSVQVTWSAGASVTVAIVRISDGTVTAVGSGASGSVQVTPPAGASVWRVTAGAIDVDSAKVVMSAVVPYAPADIDAIITAIEQNGTFDAGVGTIIYVSPTGSDANTGLVRSFPKQTIAAGIAALGGGVGVVELAPHATFTLAAGLAWDVSKVRVKGYKTTLDGSGLAAGSTVVALTSTAGEGDPSYTQRPGGPALQGVEIIGSGIAGTITGISASVAGTGEEMAHMRVTEDVVIHDVATGIALGNNVHNVEFGVDIWNAAKCIDDSAASTNAGERITFRGTYFSSHLVGNLTNGIADYIFDAASFDYNQQIFDINGPTVTCVGCHTEGNDANYGSNYPFLVGTGSLDYVGGIITGTVTAIPAYCKVTSAFGSASFRDFRLYSGPALFIDWANTVGAADWSTAQVKTPQSAKLTSSAPGSAGSAVVYEVPMNTTVFDHSGGYMPDAHLIRAPQTGYYLIQWGLDMAGNAGGTQRSAWASINADASRAAFVVEPPSATEWRMHASDTVLLNAGDTVGLHIYQDSGASLAVNANGDMPYISVIRVA